MANNNLTIFQRLSNVFRGTGRESISPDVVTTPPGAGDAANRVLFSTNDKNEYGFIKNFLNLSKERQELYVNLINKSTDIFSGAKSMFYYRLKQNLLSYYVIKPDGKETLVWTSHDWNKVLEILDEILIDVCNVDNYVDNMILDDIKYHLKEYI